MEGWVQFWLGKWCQIPLLWEKMWGKMSHKLLWLRKMFIVVNGKPCYVNWCPLHLNGGDKNSYPTSELFVQICLARNAWRRRSLFQASQSPKFSNDTFRNFRFPRRRRGPPTPSPGRNGDEHGRQKTRDYRRCECRQESPQFQANYR